MKLTEHLPSDRRDHVEGRLRGNLMAWLTTVTPGGQPISVPVWFLLSDDETFLVYSEANKAKLDNIRANPKVSLALDVTDIGRDIIRVHGTARVGQDVPPAHEHPQYVVKYAERIGTLFGTAENFATRYSVALVITPTRLFA